MLFGLLCFHRGNKRITIICLPIESNVQSLHVLFYIFIYNFNYSFDNYEGDDEKSIYKRLDEHSLGFMRQRKFATSIKNVCK